MDNISLFDFVVILVCVLVNGFVFGYWWRDGREGRRILREQKEQRAKENFRAFLDRGECIREALERRELASLEARHAEFTENLLSEYAAAIYRGTTSDDEKPN